MKATTKLRTVSALSASVAIALCAMFATPSVATPPDHEAEWDPAKGLILKGCLLTQNRTHDVIVDGRLCIKGDKIVAVVKPGQDLPSGFDEALEIDTKGVILPGLIDCHNHVEFNALPAWESTDTFENRYQWAGRKAYMQNVNHPKKLLAESKYFDIRPELMRYGEVKALVGGTTAIQGSPTAKSGYANSLVRNMDFGLEETDDIAQMLLAVTGSRFVRTERERGPTSMRAKMDSGEVKAWLVHVAEGKDEKSRAEFDMLRELGLVRDETVIIHGTALTRTEFREMGANDVDLVWSPISNRLYYGQTTDIRVARREGVNVSLAPDWSPGGSKNVLGELKVADLIDDNEWGDSLSWRDLVDMVTRNPAKALKWDDRVGQLRPGYYADILIVDWRGDPYGSVVQGVDRNVQLVLVGGDPLYGDDEHMERLKGKCEEIYNEGGRRKVIDMTDDDEEEPWNDQSVEEIEEIIDRAMRFDHDDMREKFRETQNMTRAEFAEWFDEKFADVQPMERQPLFAEGDDTFFAALNNSPVASFPYDLESFWENPDRTVGSSVGEVIARGEVGGSLRRGWSTRLRSTAGGRSRTSQPRVRRGQAVEVLEERELSRSRPWLRVRAEIDGETVEGWLFGRFFEEDEASIAAREARGATDGLVDALRDD